MKSGSKPQGFTLVEVMIVLAVTGAILLSALGLLSGSQGRTEFSQSMNDIQQRLTTTINNVANGYYPASEVSCTPGASPNDILTFDTVSPSVEQGAKKDCLFIGKIINFDRAGSMTIYSVAGARKVGNDEVQKMEDAQPTILTSPDPEIVPLRSGITVQLMQDNDSPTPDIGAVGFFTSFGETDNTVAGQLKTGTLKSDFIGLAGSSLDSDEVVNLVENTDISDTFRYTYETKKNPINGISLCFDSGSSNQHGTITIGGANKTSSTLMLIDEGSC